MNNALPIQVFEHQKLRIGDSGFKRKHFEAMVKFNEQSESKFFSPIYNGIQFKNYVGVIQIGKLTLEILPKADSKANLDKATWQGVLLQMLKVCKKIQVHNVSEARLKKRYNSILEAYFELYIMEIDHLVKKGMIKKYKKIQSNQLALKGHINFGKNIQKNLVHKERFFCEHETYTKNHLIHQILFRGMLILKNHDSFHLQDKINRLLFQFDQVTNIKVTSKNFQQIRLNRKTRPYQKALEIAKMLILNYSPNIKSGSENMLTILFDMNMLWEEYIYRILNNNKPEGYTVSFQNSAKFWEGKYIRPDIVVRNNLGQSFVIDTKWKNIDVYKPSDNDLKQMFVYNLHWNSSKSMLLYPKTDQTDTKFGNFHFQIDGKSNQCKLAFVDIIYDRNIRPQGEVAAEIFEKFES